MSVIDFITNILYPPIVCQVIICIFFLKIFEDEKRIIGSKLLVEV